MTIPTNLLIVKTSSIGDVVHALPISRLIKEHHPGIKLGWVVRKRCANLLAGNPYVDIVHVIPDKPNFFQIVELSNKLKREVYDTCFDMQGLALSGLIALVSGAKKRIGLDLNRECNKLFLTDSSVPGYKGQDCHAIDILKGFLPHAGIPIETPWPTVDYLAVKPEGLLGNIEPSENLVGLNIGASSIYKQWRIESWCRLVERLIDTGHIPILIGGAAERPIADEILQSAKSKSNGLIDSVGHTNLRESAYLIKICSALVSPDSGMMHLAVAVGTPVVGLFGSTNPSKTGPYGDQNAVIWPKIACAPCYRHPTCNGRVDCMGLITVENVMNEIERVQKSEVLAVK